MVGLGKLGGPLAACLAAAGHPVVAHDRDRTKVELVNAGKAPVLEPGLDGTMEHAIKNLRATLDPSGLVDATDACIFVTPTPSRPDGDFEHAFLEDAVQLVASLVRRAGKSDYLFVVASTVRPGYLDGKLGPELLHKLGGLRFHLAYKPEFIALGTVLYDLRHPDVTLIGADDQATAQAVEDLYRPMFIKHAPARAMSLVEAELAKIALNSAVTLKISFANQVGLIARQFGVEATRILQAVGADRRIGNHCLHPGLPYGGPCFPRDNRMFRVAAQSVGGDAPLAEAADRVNRQVMWNLLERVPVSGTVGILGMSYKPGAGLAEESAGTHLKAALEGRGQIVRCHDFQAEHNATIPQVLDCDTVVVACPWPGYAELTFGFRQLVVDPWSLLPHTRKAERMAS